MMQMGLLGGHISDSERPRGYEMTPTGPFICPISTQLEALYMRPKSKQTLILQGPKDTKGEEKLDKFEQLLTRDHNRKAIKAWE